jgi:hypothetical protein
VLLLSFMFSAFTFLLGLLGVGVIAPAFINMLFDFFS